MKGISTILAMILIVIIVVALIGLTYTFAVSLFTTTTVGATEQTQQVTEQMQKSVWISSVRCEETGQTLNFTIKNTGTMTIKAADLRFYIDETPQTLSTSFSDLVKGNISDEMGIDSSVTLTADTEYTFKVAAPAADVEKKVTCTT